MTRIIRLADVDLDKRLTKDAYRKRKIDELCRSLVGRDARNEKVRGIKLDIRVQCERERVDARK
jgi:hypothetical protein